MLVKNEHSPVMFPILHPYGHVAFQAQRADVHTVLVDGRVVKHDGRLVGIDLAHARRAVEQTVEFAQRTLGDDAWTGGMHPEIPETEILENPYQYTKWDGEAMEAMSTIGSRARGGGGARRPGGDPRGAGAPPGHRAGVVRRRSPT